MCTLRGECGCDAAIFKVHCEQQIEHHTKFSEGHQVATAKSDIQEWPDASTGDVTFKEAWLANLDRNPELIRVLHREDGQSVEGVLQIPNIDGRALLETAPQNNSTTQDRKLRGCGKCLVARILSCHLNNGKQYVIFRTCRALSFYTSIGFTLEDNVLHIDAKTARELVGRVTI